MSSSLPPGARGRAAWPTAVAWLLALGAIVWPAAIVGAAYAPRGVLSSAGTLAVYTLSSRICHQKPERSFHAAGHAWPVCARCAGLYLSAPAGALVAVARRGAHRKGKRLEASVRRVLIWAAVPTAASVIVEWTGAAPVTNLVRALAALPLGAALAYAVIAALPAATSNQVD